MKKILLILTLVISSSLADSFRNFELITDAFIDCYNKFPSRGLLVFGGINIKNNDSVKVAINYMENECPYEYNRMNSILREYDKRGRNALLSMALSRTLRNIANHLEEKASEFDKLATYILENG
ncbi:hypothetical protein [Helicobacter sp. 23-1045]